MKNGKSRQVRRFEARAQRTTAPRSTKFPNVRILRWVCLLAAVLLFGASFRLWGRATDVSVMQTELAPSDLFDRLPEGFVRMSSDERDPVAIQVRTFVDHYAKWLATATGSATELQEEANHRLGMMTAALRTIDPQRFAASEYRRGTGAADLAALSDLLNAALIPKGWAASFGVGPVGPNKTVMLIASIARCRAVKHGSVVDFHGRSIAYQSYLVDIEGRVGPIGTEAETRGGTIQLFAEEARIAGREAREIFRLVAKGETYTPSDMPWHVLRQLQADYDRLGDSSAFERFVADGVLNDTFEHELEHVRDVRLQAATRRDDIGRTALGELRAFGEARAALAEMSRGSFPLLIQGNVGCSWTGLVAGEYRQAAHIVRAVLGQFDPTTIAETQLRQRATEGLTKLDAQYDLLLKHARDPDPVRGMAEELRKTGR